MSSSALTRGLTAPDSGPTHYTLHSDLAKFCLPSATHDPNRKLAWVTSISLLFFAIGLIGIKGPNLMMRTVQALPDVVPVVFDQPEEIQRPPDQVTELPDETLLQDSPTEAPAVVTVVAADSDAVGFAVPVEGATLVARNANLATAPPPPGMRATPSKPQVSVLRLGNDAEGYRPAPPFPQGMLRSGDRLEGKVYLEVSQTGEIVKAEMEKTFGVPDLDRFTLKHVKSRWRFPAGEFRRYYWPFEYQCK